MGGDRPTRRFRRRGFCKITLKTGIQIRVTGKDGQENQDGFVFGQVLFQLTEGVEEDIDSLVMELITP